MFTSNSPSLSDIASVVGNNNDGMGGNWAWIIIILIALFGWGGNRGFGGDASGMVAYPQQSVYEGYVLQNDFSQLANKLERIGDGICDSTFALNNSILNGFTGTNTNLANGFANAELSRANAQATLMQTLNQMQFNQQNCCCETKQTINDNARAIADKIDSLVLAQKEEKIADLQNQVNQLALANSQTVQNAYLLNELRPSPVPSYQVTPPWYTNGCNYCN